MFDSASYQSSQLLLDQGDILVVSSDGLSDSQNQQGEMFGEERLLELIRQQAPGGSLALEQKLLTALQEFTQGTPQTDDITFVIVERGPSAVRGQLPARFGEQ